MFGFAKDRSLELLAKTQEQQAQMLALVSKSVDAVSQRIEDAEKRREEARHPMPVDWKGYGEAHREALVSVEDYKAEQVRKQEKLAEAALVEKQKRVAYALNLCMVSLSQIVDYQDVNVLQQEYDAVLNNLNMEKVEKDEALLDALKKILDTCHFYLLHAKDKEILKKKQAARLKGALGKALGGGNVMAIFGTPNPWAIGAAVLTMVGTAAVRYKSERDQAKLENEAEEWELEKSALEQLHNLRRTLFETAWRLADKYKFPDNYRLTEKQIKVYDDILADPDPMNRYERLDLIKDGFKAYPLFWYYLGRAALETANLYRCVDEETRKAIPGVEHICDSQQLCDDYLKKAREAFDSFREAHEGNEILREDLLSASAYLDYASFFNDPESVFKYVDKAHDLAGMDFEINQMCAFRYLQVLAAFEHSGDLSSAGKAFVKAERCLRFLVNEGFNPELNGRALSQIYKMHPDNAECKNAYNILKTCVARKKPYVYGWILPWDSETMKRDVELYLGGDGIRRTAFNYQYGRLRLIYGDFFAAVARAKRENDLQPIRDLKEKPKLSGAVKSWDSAYDMSESSFVDWKDDEDPVYGCQAQFWGDVMTGAGAAAKSSKEPQTLVASLIGDLRGHLVETEYKFVTALKKFIHSTSERKWISLGFYRHDTDYCASVVDGDIAKIEEAFVAFVKAVAIRQSLQLVEKYATTIKADLETPEIAVYDTPLGIQLVDYMEKEAERMRKQIETAIMGGRFAYPQVTFPEIGTLCTIATATGSLITPIVGCVGKFFGLFGRHS